MSLSPLGPPPDRGKSVEEADFLVGLFDIRPAREGAPALKLSNESGFFLRSRSFVRKRLDDIGVHVPSVGSSPAIGCVEGRRNGSLAFARFAL